ncbi:MAG TPA: PadR family transcriptional regulator [Actinocrinis sp.]
MSYVEILILRHLRSRPAHGYELRKRVEETTGVLLHNNSLYPALRRFEEAGAVTKTAQLQEGRPPKHVYELTGLGRELLHDMLAELDVEQAGDDVEFHARLGQFGLLTPQERRGVLASRERALVARLEHLRRQHGRAAGELWAEAAIRRLIQQAEDERAWLAELDALADAPYGAADSDGPQGGRGPSS